MVIAVNSSTVEQPLASPPAAVAMRGISKQFGATQALSDVSMDLQANEIRALVGENGAGKSTLVKDPGRYPPTRFRDDRPWRGADPAARAS